ncbi:GNAT family N-acetyltransferase [Microbacterium sp. NPDC055903]
MAFEKDLGDGLALALRTPEVGRALRPVIAANIERLRLWEPWAHGFDPDEAHDDYNREQLRRFLDGTALPAVLMRDGRPVGAVSAQIDRYAGTAELGYWIDAESEGKGVVRRACRAVMTDLFSDGVQRIEIRTATHNRRSIRLAERLGFEREGTLRSALPVGGSRHDLAVFGCLPG